MLESDAVLAVNNQLNNLGSSKYQSNRTDAYLALFTHFSKSGDAAAQVMLKRHVEFFAGIKDDIKSNNKALAESALYILGQSLSVEVLARSCDEETAKEILCGLCSLLGPDHEKTIIVRSFWCLSKQVFAKETIHAIIPRVVSCFRILSEDKGVSATVINGGLEAISKFCDQCPDVMMNCVWDWFDIVINLTTSSVPKNRELSLEVITKNLNLLLSVQESVSKFLVEDLKKSRARLLSSLYEQHKEMHVLNVWSCLLKLIRKDFFTLKKDIVNVMLQQATKALQAKQLAPDVIMAWNCLWRTVIDTFALNPDKLTDKATKLLLPPILVRQKVESNAVEVLLTGWHLICALGNFVEDSFDQVVIPVLAIAFPGCGVLTPFQALGSTYKGSESPVALSSSTSTRAIRSPVAASKVMKGIGAELVRQLLIGCTEDVSPAGRARSSRQIERFPGKKLAGRTVLSHWRILIFIASDSLEHCDPHDGGAVIGLWTALLSELLELEPLVSKKKFLTMWSDVLVVFDSALHGEWKSVSMILKVVSGVPEAVLAGSVDSLRSSSNESGSVGLQVLFLLFHESFARKGFSDERSFVIYERVLRVFMDAITDQLAMTGSVLQLLMSSSRKLADESTNWRLWSTLAGLLQKYVHRSHDVNQGSALEYDFQTVLRALTYPIRCIDISKLVEGPIREMVKTLSDLYSSFNAAVTLLPGADVNRACEEFSKSVLEVLSSNGAQWQWSKPVGILLRIFDVVVDCLNVADPLLPPSGPATPTKLAQKLQEPLANFKSLISVVRLILEVLLTRAMKDKHDLDTEIIGCFDLMGKFFGKLHSSSLLIRSSSILLKDACTLLNKHPKVSGKIMLKLEKLLCSVFENFETCQALSMEEFLSEAEFILISCLLSDRKQLQALSVKFWNKHVVLSSNLMLSSELRAAFKKVSSKFPVVFPGSIPGLKRSPFRADYEDAAQFPDSMKTNGTPSMPFSVGQSPLKVHGSFLGKSPANEFSPAKHSPYKTSPSVAFKSPFSSRKSVRRKLPVSFEDDSTDYVKIESPVKHKRLLTERQKDRLSEKSSLPALYNDLDRSQDTLLFRNLSLEASAVSQASSNDGSSILRDDCYDASEPHNSSIVFPCPQKLADLAVENECLQSPPRAVSSHVETVLCEDTQSKHPSGGTEDTSEVEVIEETLDSFEDKYNPSTCQNGVVIINAPSMTDRADKQASTLTCALLVEGQIAAKFPMSRQRAETQESCNSPAQFDTGAKDKLYVSETPESICVEQVALADILKTRVSNMSALTNFPDCQRRISSSSPSVEELGKPSVDSSKSVRSSARQSCCREKSKEVLNKRKKTRPVKNFRRSARKNKSSLLQGEKPVALSRSIGTNVGKRSSKSGARLSCKLETSGNQEARTVASCELFAGEDVKGSLSVNSSDGHPIVPVEPLADLRAVPKCTTTRKGIEAHEKSVDRQARVIVTKISTRKRKRTSMPSAAEKRSTKRKKSKFERDSVSRVKDGAWANRDGPQCRNSERVGSLTMEASDECSETKSSKENFSVADLNRNYARTAAKLTLSESHDVDCKFQEELGVSPVCESCSSDEDCVPLDVIRKKPSKWHESTRASFRPGPINVTSPDKAASGALDATVATKKPQLVDDLFCESGSKLQTDLSRRPSDSQDGSGCVPAVDCEAGVKVLKDIVPFQTCQLGASPVGSILKKCLRKDSPSPPNHCRRVSFQLPMESLNGSSCHSDAAMQESILLTPSKVFTLVRTKTKAVTDNQTALVPIYPDLVTCATPVEKILPSLTLSRGLTNLVRAQNIKTVGDVSALSEVQIESLPFRSPKVESVRNALKVFAAQSGKLNTHSRRPRADALYPIRATDMQTGSPTSRKVVTTSTEDTASLGTPPRNSFPAANSVLSQLPPSASVATPLKGSESFIGDAPNKDTQSCSPTSRKVVTTSTEDTASLGTPPRNSFPAANSVLSQLPQSASVATPMSVCESFIGDAPDKLEVSSQGLADSSVQLSDVSSQISNPIELMSFDEKTNLSRGVSDMQDESAPAISRSDSIALDEVSKSSTVPCLNQLNCVASMAAVDEVSSCARRIALPTLTGAELFDLLATIDDFKQRVTDELKVRYLSKS